MAIQEVEDLCHLYFEEIVSRTMLKIEFSFEMIVIYFLTIKQMNEVRR